MRAAEKLAIRTRADSFDSFSHLTIIHDWLFTHYWFGFANIWPRPNELSKAGSNALLQLGYIALFGALAF